MMDDLLQRLRRIHDNFNLPANDTHIRWLSTILQATAFPKANEPIAPQFDDLVTILRDHNGMPVKSGRHAFPIRMMSFEEANATHSNMRNLEYISNNQYLFWTDDNSNYIGIYLCEPIMGHVFFLNHDEPDHSPRLRSVRRLYEELLIITEHNAKSEDGDEDENDCRSWWDLPTDFPKQAPDPDHDKADREAAQVYIDRYHNESNEDYRQYYAFVAMSLLPFNVREPLVMFANDTRDMYVQQRAIEIFRLRKDNQAVEQIEAIIKTTPRNPRSAGVYALIDIGTEEAKQAFLRIMPILTGGHEYMIIRGLEQFGYEVRKDKPLSYRASSDDDWIEITHQDTSS